MVSKVLPKCRRATAAYAIAVLTRVDAATRVEGVDVLVAVTQPSPPRLGVGVALDERAQLLPDPLGSGRGLYPAWEIDDDDTRHGLGRGLSVHRTPPLLGMQSTPAA